MANPISVPGSVVPSGSLISPGGAQGVQGLQGSLGPVGTMPVGTIVLYVAGGAPPASWMACDGSAVSRTLYPDLFTAIGTTWGAGDGSTTFNLPDIRGRTVVGVGQGTGLTNRVLAAKGGEETHQLVVAEMPSHTHVYNLVGGSGSLTYAAGAFTQFATGNTNPTGGDGFHNTMMPFLVMPYIIKVSASGGATAQAPIADSTQPGLMRMVSGNSTDFIDGTNNSQPLQPVIWSVRLRSFNALGNPTFEVDQINCGGLYTFGAASQQKLIDRWSVGVGGTLRVSAQQVGVGGTGLTIPGGPNVGITTKAYRITLTTQQAVLGANDYLALTQTVEAPLVREMANDVTSMSILVKSSVANLIFGLGIRDSNITHSLVNPCTISAANTWLLLPVPNIPIFPAGGSFPVAPGSQGYIIHICLAAGSSSIASANGTWQNANVIGANGQSNFAAQAVNSTFDIAFVQHEPGAVCTTPIDCPFTQNYDDCLRYYCKSYNYAVKPGTVTDAGAISCDVLASQIPSVPVAFKKTMAKAPTTLTGFSNITGAAAVRDLSAAIDRTTTGVITLGETGYGGFYTSTTNTGGAVYQWHYTADTGW